MAYEKDYKILSNILNERVLIESPFQETTRVGLNKSSVMLALTRKEFVIIMRRRLNLNPVLYYNRIQSQYALDDVQLSIFKQTRRQVLKVCFQNKTVQYFELGTCKKRKIFWEIWCNHIRELKDQNKKWPFRELEESCSYHETEITNTTQTTPVPALPDEVLFNINTRPIRKRWTDKHIYLGSKREEQDKNKPVPLEPENAEGIKLLYLMSEHLVCRDQAEHWVQRGDSVFDSTRIESPVSTYTGQPTTKVTYTSIITAVRFVCDHIFARN